MHVGCAAASYALFIVRGAWMIRDSALLRRCWVRIVRPGRPKPARVACWIAAQGVFVYVVAVAYTRKPLIFWG